MVDRFAERLLGWYDRHGRKGLPWQENRTAYTVWLAEIMLQQTQVATVIPYYQRFLEYFPHITVLAEADIDEVLHLWSGLGYYARGRNLHRAAQVIRDEHGGVFPQSFEEVVALPGIGRSTAGAILSQAFGQRHPILDGNVKRLLSRIHAVEGWPGKAPVERLLWQLASRYLPHERMADYTQAIMDFGATLCSRHAPTARLQTIVMPINTGGSKSCRPPENPAGCHCAVLLCCLLPIPRVVYCWNGVHRQESGAGCGVSRSVATRWIRRAGAVRNWGVKLNCRSLCRRCITLSAIFAW